MNHADDEYTVQINTEAESAIDGMPREDNITFSARQNVLFGYEKKSSDGSLRLDFEGEAELNSLFQEDQSRKFTVSPSVDLERELFDSTENGPKGFMRMRAEADFSHETDLGASAEGTIFILFDIKFGSGTP